MTTDLANEDERQKEERLRLMRRQESRDLEEQLHKTARLSQSDRRQLALNMGTLATRIDPEAPLEGAMTIIRKSDLQELRQKRKRVIRLPGEDAPESSATGEYVSSGATFLTLAKTAAAILSTGQRAEYIEHETQAAIRTLLKGTSFLPTYVPKTQAERSIKSLIDDYASRLAQAVGDRTRIMELWDRLQDSPVGLAVGAPDENLLSVFGPVADVPKPLLQPYLSSVVDEVHFVAGKAHDGWCHPTIYLGRVAIRSKVLALAIPEELKDCFLEDGIGSARISDCAREWMDSVLPDGDLDRLDELDPKERENAGIETATLSSICKIALKALPGNNGQPSLSLAVYDAGYSRALEPESNPFTSGFAHAVLDGAIQDDLIELYPDDENTWAVLFNAFPVEIGPDGNFVVDDEDEGAEDEKRFLVAYEDAERVYYDFATMQGPNWTDSPQFAELLLSGKHQFFPEVPGCATTASPLPPESVGAALIANLETAADTDRIDKMLIEKARLTADAGLAFLDALMERSRAALDRI